jgi:hypothetical protein
MPRFGFLHPEAPDEKQGHQGSEGCGLGAFLQDSRVPPANSLDEGCDRSIEE